MLPKKGNVAAALLATTIAAATAGAATTEVIPPGQEALIERMLTAPEQTGCEVQDIDVHRQHISTRVSCPAGTWPLELRHPSLAGELDNRVAVTERFAVGAGEGHDTGVVARMVERIRANEAEFRWVAASEGVSAPPTDLPSPGHVEKREDDPLWERYRVGYELFQKKRHVEAFEHFLAMAREHPTYSGVLGMLVANLAPQQPDAARVEALQKTADANPDSPLDNFLAGVAAHYSAHYKAQTVEEKKELYADAIRYLERARPEYDFEPRVFIYLAVSHFRLGHQEKAEALIEQGVALNREDPDAYYCRAEIFHRTEPARAIEDIDRYLELTKAEGGVSSGKVERVRKMREYLVRVQSGEQELQELWDPITGDTYGESYEVPEQAELLTRWGPWVLGGLAALLLLSSLLVYWLRRRSKSQSSA